MSNMTDGTWSIPDYVPHSGLRDHREVLKYHRLRIGEIVKLYPDFPARADRRGIPGHDTHNPKRAQ
jgi:hypothetical protein